MVIEFLSANANFCSYANIQHLSVSAKDYVSETHKQTFSSIDLIGPRLVLSSLSTLSSSPSSSSSSESSSFSESSSSLSVPSAESARAYATSLNNWMSFSFCASNGFRINLAMRLTVCTKHRVWLAGLGNSSRESLRYWIILSLLDALSPVTLSICATNVTGESPPGSDKYSTILPCLLYQRSLERLQKQCQDSPQCVT